MTQCQMQGSYKNNSNMQRYKNGLVYLPTVILLQYNYFARYTIHLYLLVDHNRVEKIDSYVKMSIN